MIKLIILALIGILVLVSGCTNPEVIPTNGQITIPADAHVIITTTTTQIENGSQIIIDIQNKGQETTIQLTRGQE